MPEVDEAELTATEAKLKAAKAALKVVEDAAARVREAHEHIKIDSATCAELRNLVNGYRERLIRFKDLEAIEDKLAEYEKRLAALEKGKTK